MYDKKTLELHDINVVDIEVVLPEEKKEHKINTLEQSILTSIKEALTIESVEDTKIAEEKLDIGKPLDFSANEKHSFQEWLQLSRTEPIDREKENEDIPETPIIDEEKKKKAELIDKFIETSPKISPVKHGVAIYSNFRP